MIIDFATGKVKKPAPPETATPVSSPEPKKPYTPAKSKPARRTGPCSCRSSA